jgi:cellulose synthase/poly-beta-1,6-N-acetylglucosamine synthase-like glycosyltransferase
LNDWIDIALLGVACVLLVPVLVFCVECLLAFPPRRQRSNSTGPRPRVALLVPAHNEEAGISETLRSLMPQMYAGDRIVVVADNCTDSTGDLAAGAGCEVVRRFDSARRGKGYALDAGMRHIARGGVGDAPDVVIVFDADCIAQPGAVETLARRAAESGRPVQGTYLMALPSGPPSPNAAVSALAVLVKNFVRPRGLARLRLPCLLTGTGMAFPWAIIREANLATGNIVEDMQLGIELTLAGHAPLFCEEARVIGRLPATDRASQTQRRRWEHGHLRVLLREAPRLLVGAVRRGDVRALALGLDVCVPPLALLVMLTTLAASVAALAIPLLGASPLPAILLGSGLVGATLCVKLAWLRFGRRAMPIASVLGAPRYALAKVPLYATFVRRSEKQWVRTERTPAPPLPTATRLRARST